VDERETDVAQAMTVRVWHVGTGKPVGRWLLPWVEDASFQVSSLAFTSDGRTLAISYDVGRDIHLWEVVTGRQRGTLRGHQGAVLALALSPDGRLLASGSEDGTILIQDLEEALGGYRPRKERLGDKDLRRRWAALREKDPGRAGAGVRALAAAPADSVAFLGRRLRPVLAPPAKDLLALIAKLGSADFATRDEASRRLAALGEAAEGGLRLALAKKPDVELHQRIDRLLAPLMNPDLTPERLRQLRAVEVLERVGDPGARRVLARLASGVAEARLSLEAKAALRRLQRKAVAR